MTDVDPTPIPITYSDHARRRMQQRNVSEAQVTATIHFPDARQYRTDGKVRVIRQTAVGATLQAVYEERRMPDGSTCAHVVTIMRGKR